MDEVAEDSGPAPVRACWEDLPEQVRAAAEAHLASPVVEVSYPDGGFTQGLAARVTCVDRSEAFLKAADLSASMAEHYRAEAAVGSHLLATVAPQLLWSLEEGGWVVNAFEAVGGREPDLGSGSSDLPGVLDLVGSLERELTSCPARVGPVGDTLSQLTGHWEKLAAGPSGLGEWAAARRDQLLELDDRDLLVKATLGDTLLHCDLRADNILTDGLRVRILDWSWASRGAAWVDAAFFVPQLIVAGHSPAAAEAALTDRVPVWRTVDPDAVDRFAVAITGYWSWHHAHGPGGGLGAYRGRAAEAGRSWIDYRLS
jgi:hypothetical protein